MKFESGSELRQARELKQAQIWKSANPEDLGWWEGWWVGWPRMKTAVMEAEREVQQSTVPWAEAWAQAQERAWAEVKATLAWRVGGEEAKRAVAVALFLGEVWGGARARARGECVPDGLADPPTIANILISFKQSGLACTLWDDSLEMRNEYWCIIQLIAPITRLPIELLHQIFLAIIEETSGPPLALMLVCKQWHDIVIGIWSSLNLGTTTPMDAVAKKLERNQWLLDIVVDTDPDYGHWRPPVNDFRAIFAAYLASAPIRPRAPGQSLVVESFPAWGGAFEAIFAAIEATPRWRSFIVESFPAQADLQEDVVNRHLQRHSNATMNRFTTFRIKSACETSALLNGLLHILGTTAGPALTTVEINSPNVISFLAPAYSSFFHSVKVLSLDAPGIHDPVDLLPHLHQLETFTVSHLSFPTYHSHVELPFVHTLRRLSLRAASIQWMSGRIFHTLEHCALIFPCHQHVLHTFSATLPNCNHLIFQGYPLNILGGVSAHKLSHLSVTCSGSFNRRGSQELVWFSAHVLGERQLAPKTLHISIQATNQAWMSSLVFMSDLEELVIHGAQPSTLGAKVFQSLVMHPVHTSNMGAISNAGELGAPLCPSLRRFGLNYDRWLRQSEEFDLVPVFMSIIQSRQQSKYSLRSFNLRIMGDQVELIEGSGMSDKGFNRLHRKINPTPTVDTPHHPTSIAMPLHSHSTIIYRRTPRPAAIYSPDIHVAIERCRANGGEENAIALLQVIFSDGISEKALIRQMTSEEAGEHNRGMSGQVYRMLLRNDDVGRFHCRLCPVGSNGGGWRNARDVLRHLKRDHFGLGDACKSW